MEKEASARANTRSKETAKLKETRGKKNASYRAKARSKETAKEKEERQKNEATLKRLRREQKVPKSQYAARNTIKVLTGEQIVPELKDSSDSIGCMETICTYCEARKWKDETPSIFVIVAR